MPGRRTEFLRRTAIRRLHAKPAMWPAMVVPNVLAQDALCVEIVEDDEVVEAISPERPDDPFAKRVRLRGSGRRDQASRAEAFHSPSEVGAIDRVAVVNEEPWRMVLAVAHSLNEGLGGILSTRRRGHSQAHTSRRPRSRMTKA